MALRLRWGINQKAKGLQRSSKCIRQRRAEINEIRMRRNRRLEMSKRKRKRGKRIRQIMRSAIRNSTRNEKRRSSRWRNGFGGKA